MDTYYKNHFKSKKKDHSVDMNQGPNNEYLMNQDTGFEQPHIEQSLRKRTSQDLQEPSGGLHNIWHGQNCFYK